MAVWFWPRRWLESGKAFGCVFCFVAYDVVDCGAGQSGRGIHADAA